jgi:cystathionine beta-lyase
MGHVNPLTELSLTELRGRRSVKWTTHPSDVLPMFIAEMDTPLAPAISVALGTAVAAGDTGYAAAGRLGEAFAAFAHRRFGWWPAPNAMRLAPDVNTGIAEAVRALTPHGSAIVIDTPAYPPFFSKLAHSGREVVENPLLQAPDGEYDIDLDGLERAFAAGAAAYLMCNPHNPTGTVFRREALEAVVELADAYHVRLLADEVHAPLTYPGVDFTALQLLPGDAAQRAVTFVSASKAWNLAGLKAALVVPAPDAVADLDAMPAEVSFGAGLFGVIAGEAAFAEGETWLDTLRHGLEHNRKRLGARLAEELPLIGYRPPDATYLAWLDCRALGLGDDPTVAFLERGRVALNAGPAFGPPGRGFARLNFGTRPDLIDEGVRRIARAVATSGATR